MAHEAFDRAQEVQGSSNRAFGAVFAVVFAIVACAPLILGGAMRWWALLVGLGFSLVAAARPQALAPLNRLWFKLGLVLHKIVSPIVLGIMFFGVITPMGLAMRAFGKDPLRLRLNKLAPSYWILREPPGPPGASLKDQF